MRLASIYDIDAKYSALKLALEEIKVSNVDKVGAVPAKLQIRQTGGYKWNRGYSVAAF